MDVGVQVATNDFTSSIDLVSSLIKQLGEACVKLKSHNDALEDKIQWNDVENHFHQMESMLKKKYEDLKVKEEEFAEKESETRRIIAERESVVAAKEQDLLNDIQELKDAAAAAIMEARSNHKLESSDPDDTIDGDNNKVSGSLDDENAPLLNQEEEYPHDVGKNTECLDKANSYSDLIQSCKLMDAKGILNFIMENHKDLSSVRSGLSVALSSATEPARLVLESLEGFFPSAKTTGIGNTKQGGNGNEALKVSRQSCVVIMEALAAMLAKADPHVDNFLNHEIKEQAKAIADEWMPKLAVEGNDASNENGNSLEVEGFLRLLATFRIGSDFDQDELCKLVLAVAHRHRQATELCLSLGLTQKMPGIIEVLINNGKLIDAVHLIQAFQLSGTFPPVPLLKTYLKDVRRNSQGKGGDTSLQILNNTRELTALKIVVKCVKEYKLQADYPLLPLETRMAQLLKSKANDKKRTTGELGKYQQVKPHQHPKKAKTNGGFHRHHAHTAAGRVAGITRQAELSYLTERTPAYAEIPERYPRAIASTYNYPIASQTVPDMPERYPHATVSTYNYPVANQAGYAAPLANDQKLLYYQLDDVRTSAGYGSSVPSYGSYAGSGLHTSHTRQPYM